MLAGLSVTSFFSILAAFGLAQSNQPATTAVAPATAPAATAPAATAPATAARGLDGDAREERPRSDGEAGHPEPRQLTAIRASCARSPAS